METEMTDWLQAPSQQELQGSKLWWKLRSGTRLRHAAREHVEDWLSTEIIVSGILLSQIDGHAFSRRWLKREDRKKQKRAQQLLRCSAKLKKKAKMRQRMGRVFPLLCCLSAACMFCHYCDYGSLSASSLRAATAECEDDECGSCVMVLVY